MYFKEGLTVVDLDDMNIMYIDNIQGFIYNGDVYIDLFSSMSLLGFEKFDENHNSTYLWSTMYKEFYAALRQLRINPDEYCIPLIQEPKYNKNGTMSDYKFDLPAFIVESVLLKIAEKKRDKGLTLNSIKRIMILFKNPKQLVLAEYNKHKICNTEYGFDNLIFDENGQKDGHFEKENFDENGQKDGHMEAKPMKKYNLTTCFVNSLPLTGFVKNGNIFLNTKEAGFAIGIEKREGLINKIRWELYYKYYTTASTRLENENSEGVTLSEGTNKRGHKSKYEQLMPEYIPLIVVFGVASYLHNYKAVNFKFEFLKNSLPFFLNNAPKEEINNVNFLRNIKPLLDERERQLGIEHQQQAQYMEIQYQNYIRSLQYFNSTMNNQGLRPAIPGGTTNFSGMAYAMPNPEDIQKNLDSQPKDRIDVVRFENPNKIN